MIESIIDDGEGRYSVLSSDGVNYYQVTIDSCSCIGFRIRNKCRHMDLVAIEEEKRIKTQKVIPFDKEEYAIGEFMEKYPNLNLDDLERRRLIVVNGGLVYII